MEYRTQDSNRLPYLSDYEDNSVLGYTMISLTSSSSQNAWNLGYRSERWKEGIVCWIGVAERTVMVIFHGQLKILGNCAERKQVDGRDSSTKYNIIGACFHLGG
jgi:hypothetical protein